MAKRVMILGAGRGQLPLINICKEMGCETIVISPEGNYPGFKYADRCYLHNVKEKEEVLKVAGAEKVEAILTDQLDAGVLTAAFVSEKLGIPGIGYDVALKFTDKYVMRKEAQALGVNVPVYFGVGHVQGACAAAEKTGYPLIMKPVDNGGSRGVFLINSEAELRENFAASLQHSLIRTVIVEQYIAGKEYCVDCYTRNHKVKSLIIGHRDYFNLKNRFIPRATVCTDADSATGAVERRILEINERLVTGFGLNSGITHGEYMYDDKADKIYLVEIAARGGGMFVSSDLIPLGCGINAIRLLVENALGLNLSNYPVNLKPGASAYFSFLLPLGRVVRIENAANIKKLAGVSKAYFDNLSVGMKIGRVKDKSSRKGPVIVYGKTKQDCYDVISNVKELLRIDVETPDCGIKGIRWDG
jgi:carbamoyl-phosphate synthase large subunit